MESSRYDPPSYRERYAILSNAEKSKNALIEELIQRVDTLTDDYRRECLDRAREAHFNRETQLRVYQFEEELRKAKTFMERNPFVLVLIDGDGMIFEDTLLKKGEAGGKEAASLLWTIVRDYLSEEQDLRELPSDCKIVTRIYANIRGLAETCYKTGIIDNKNKIEEFARGFTHSKQLFDFVDVGSGKDRADDKISEVFKLHLFDCHCKLVILGCSHDNGYARLLEEYTSDDAVKNRIGLLEGVPFERELVTMQNSFRSMKFKGLFRSSKIVVPTQPQHSPQVMMSPPITRTMSSLSATTNGSSYASTPTNGSGAWAAAAAMPPVALSSPPLTPQPIQTDPMYIPRNRWGQRIDSELKYDRNMVKQVKALKMCNVHFLRGDCPYETCSHDHFYKPSKNELATLRYIARMAPCRMGSECDDAKCIYGHRCPAGNPCAFGDTCRFPDEMHNMDLTVVKGIKV